jgi:basic amino acid/polyamine antiporter, APA family
MMRHSEPLVRAMGTLGLAAAIVNITIGGGIFRLPANVASSLGAAAPIAYLVCAAAMALIVRCIAVAGSRVSLTGGPYAYVGAALGPYAGFISGVLLWMLGTFAGAAVATVFASSVGLLIGNVVGKTMEFTILAAAFTFWCLVNLRGVELGSRLNSIATVAKLLPLLLVAVGGLFFLDPANLTWTASPSTSDVARTSLLLIFAFAGLEVALVPSGEVRDTERTVPRAIALAMIGITTLYIALQMSAQGILGNGLAQANVSPLADAANAAFGPWARTLLLAGAAVSMFGYLGGMTLSVPRMVYAFARDGFLPRVFATVDLTHHVPRTAIVAQSLLVVALAVTGTFERLAILANVSALALYFGCALAAWRLTGKGVVPALACGVIVWLLTGLTQEEWLGFGVCVVLATLVYAVTAGRRARANATAVDTSRASSLTSGGR